jgi:hypothetical protein
MPGMKPGMPPVGLGSSNALLTGLPNSGGAVAGQGGAMAGVVVGGALPDKMNTLFIGSIAPGINKVAMEKLLRVKPCFNFASFFLLLFLFLFLFLHRLKILGIVHHSRRADDSNN